MDDDQHDNPPWKAQPSTLPNSKQKHITAILTRLSLACPPASMEPRQFKLVMADLVTDLEPYSIYEIEQAVAAWRTSGERFFPTASGQLIQKINERREASIRSARYRETYRQPQIDVDRKWPYQHRPWRDILREHGRPIPPDDSPLAMQLDQLQKPPRWA